MITSRRLAREWALKILYQIDVGKFGAQEAEDAAMERLRREFVQRGSRTASGSRAEEIGIEAVTGELRDVLPTLRPPMERALALCAGRLFDEMPYWQEVRLERSFRTQAPGVPLDPPRLLAPLPDAFFVSLSPDESDGLAVPLSALTEAETARYLDFVVTMREQLPRLFDPQLRKTGLARAKDLAANRPLGASPAERQAYLRRRREEFNCESAAYWRNVGTPAQKQTGDWLRTAAFTLKLVRGVLKTQRELDKTLTGLAAGWRLERQAAVDRNILRLAAFEMLHLPDIPTGASINEAVELAKKYSTAESGRFVNGVLGALAARVGEKPLAGTEREPHDTADIAEMEEPELE